MGLNRLLDHLSPLRPEDAPGWAALSSRLRSMSVPRDPVMAWYLSSAFDTQALAYFMPGAPGSICGAPPIDVWIYSDYSPWAFGKMMEWRQQLDRGPVCTYSDHCHLPDRAPGAPARTEVWIERMVTLRHFREHERSLLLADRTAPPFRVGCAPVRADGADFLCLLVRFRSQTLGERVWPILWSSVDNWVLAREVFTPLGVRFSHFCAVCDGCRLGMAHTCANRQYRDFLPVATPNSYWITDHAFPPGEHVATFRGWGHYGRVATRKDGSAIVESRMVRLHAADRRRQAASSEPASRRRGFTEEPRS